MIQKTLVLVIVATFLGACTQLQPQSDIEEAVEQAAETELQQSLEIAPLWLEEVEGEQALNKVSQWNQSSLNTLQSDPRFDAFQTQALEIVNATDKIAYGTYRGGYVYNFWQDETHVRGILRRTSLQSYMSDNTEWDVLLDIDALAESEDANWVYKGSSCLEPDYTRCLLSLSNGGKDAVEMREWDHNEKSFVEDGFFIPEAKGGASWIDENTIIVGTDFGEGTLTESGYPFISKILSRGQQLDAAKQIFTGEVTDVAAGAFQLKVGEDQYEQFGYRAETFYEYSYFWLPNDTEEVLLPIPRKSSPLGVFKKQLLVRLNEDWQVGDDTFKTGALVSMDLDAWKSNPDNIQVDTVYEPSTRATVQSISITKSRVLVTVLENVVGKIYAFDLASEGWTSYLLDLPENGTVSVTSANDTTDFILVNQETFTSPDALLYVDVVENTSRIAKSSPERFDSSNVTVQQLSTTSKDGTEIPYFIVHKKDLEFDGTNPTLQYAYGGFQVSMTPRYSAITGKLWLENGGVYVLANIRGGGEFGPLWHQAGLKTNRQVIFDDMIAVSEDLIARKITSPEKLGIMGGSNGGLLMGVMYTQRPDLYNAVVCQVPLLDMLRYHTLLAGASWVGEYGSPDIPEERAFLESISPVHNVKQNTLYPNIFFVT
ncbi:MAG: prolyl oligopeptidase family serine peptidase, partial [Pseudomonadota bacterium]